MEIFIKEAEAKKEEPEIFLGRELYANPIPGSEFMWYQIESVCEYQDPKGYRGTTPLWNEEALRDLQERGEMASDVFYGIYGVPGFPDSNDQEDPRLYPGEIEHIADRPTIEAARKLLKDMGVFFKSDEHTNLLVPMNAQAYATSLGAMRFFQQWCNSEGFESLPPLLQGVFTNGGQLEAMTPEAIDALILWLQNSAGEISHRDTIASH